MRLFEIDAIKSIAIIGVMIAHMSFESRFDAGALKTLEVGQLLLGWCVLAFFFCSGLLARPVTGLPELIGHIQKRFWRLVIPCIVFSMSYRLIRCGLYLTGKFEWESPIPEHFLDGVHFVFTPVGPQFYFLYYLFAVSVLVALLDLIFLRKYMTLLAGFIVPIVYVLMELPDRAYGPEKELIPLYMISYMMGMACADKNISARWGALFCVLPVTVVMLVTQSWVAGYVVIPYLLWLFFRRAPKVAEGVAKTKLGKYSAAIYVWHAPIIMPLLSIICVRLLGGSAVVLIPILVGALLCSVLLGEITSRVGVLRPWRF